MQQVRVENFGDAPNHCHSIDEVDMRKRSKFIRDAIAQEAAKSYAAPAITNVIREEVEKEHPDSGVKHLKWLEAIRLNGIQFKNLQKAFALQPQNN